MSKNTSPSGLLSRMAKFVKNSATGWSDLDQLDSRQDASDTRQALKDMIERKRRNDASRRDEFETLRKIRRGEVAKNKTSSSDAGPSSYLNSAPPDAVRPHRARTLERKIDQIEEQMAQAWFKKPRNDAAPEPQAPPPEPAPHAPPAVENTAFAATVPMSHLPEGVVEVVPPSMEDEHDTLVDAPATKAEEPPTHADAPHEHVPHATGEDRDAYTFGIMGDFNVEVSAEMPQDAELEESAIRFANGDAAGAEESLRALIAEGGPRQDHENTWLCLFDLYRATAQQAKFDETAIEFASRFGRSAPQWGMLTPEKLAQMARHAASPKNARAALAQWAAPATLSVQSMAALAGAIKRNTPPWRIDWRSLKSINPDALPALTEQLHRWADSGDRVKFLGAEALLDILAEKTPNEDRNTDTQWWTARLALLRLMGEMDEFDLVALNYCVTYEVSPPAWQAPRCHYTAMTPEGETILAELGGEPAAAAQDTHAPQEDVQLIEGHLRAQLSGEILDDPTAILAPIRERLGDARYVELNCRFVLRVDFAAAGMLLNWAADLQAQEKKVAFTNLNRLIALFFGVVGIPEVARVSPRQD